MCFVTTVYDNCNIKVPVNSLKLSPVEIPSDCKVIQIYSCLKSEHSKHTL
jgi:hypothetical protein